MKAKLYKQDKIKMQLYYNKKFEEYSKLTPEALKDIFNAEKLSSTAKQALVDVTRYMLYQERVKAMQESNPVINEEHQNGTTE